MNCFKAENYYPIPTTDLISWLFENQKYDPDEPIWLDAIDSSRSISSRQARVLIRKLVAGFRAVGLQLGDCVCVHSFNDIYYPILFLGIIAAGGIFTGTNPAYTTRELNHHLRASQAKFIISEVEILPNMLEAAKQSNLPRKNIFVFDVVDKSFPGLVSWKELLQHGEQDWVRFDNEEISQSTTASRMFSSGTSGLPKAAVITHYNFIAQHTLAFELYEPEQFKVRRLHVLPMFHMAAVLPAHIAPLRGISTVTYVMRRFDLEPYLANIERHKITDVIVVPPLVVNILLSPHSRTYSLKSIKQARCGAAPLDKGLQARFRKLLSPDATLTQAWGLTETTCTATLFHYPEDDTTGSIGKVIPNHEVMLLNDDGKNITRYDVNGEICLKGPCIIPGYYQNEKANAESFTSEGWFKTGDIGFCSSETKKWYIVDRKKELIKVRGFQVAPLEIEGVLIAHPGVADAAVIGVRLSPEGSELPRAYIVRRPGLGDTLSEEEIRHYASQNLAKYKRLDGGVIFIDAIPKNATGKTLKRDLREMAKAEINLFQQSKL